MAQFRMLGAQVHDQGQHIPISRDQYDTRPFLPAISVDATDKAS